MPAPAPPPGLSPATAAAVLPALAAKDLRLTRHRQAVLAVLEAADRPLATEEIVTRSGVPTSTAYRNLSELMDAGVVARITGAAGGDRHELAEAYSAHHHHHHLVCEVCGMVTDFAASPALERLIDAEIGSLAAVEGFQPSHHVFDVRGTCRRCQLAG